MPQQYGMTGDRAGTRARTANELGWDDALYDDRVPPSRPRRDGGDAAGDTATGRTAAGDEGHGGTPGSGVVARAADRPRRRVLRWFALVTSMLILGTAGAGYVYYRHLNANLRTGERSTGDSDVEKTGPNQAGQSPLNVLLLGSDSRNSAANLELGGSKGSVGQKPLADVQMLLHISADRRNASVVTIPRDTRVHIPECTDPESGAVYPAVNTIINSSLGRGGPGCTLATWQNLTGLYIDHWVTIDFAGVVKMADAVGGVDVCVRQNVWDRPLPGVPGGSGLKLTAGTHTIQGEQALRWLRTRHAFHSDLGRAKAQHMYLNAMLRELRSQNVFTDTARLMGLAEAATKALQVSHELGSVKRLFDLATQLKSVPTERITMATMPTVTDPLNPNHLVPAPADAGTLWSMLREDAPLDTHGKKDADGKDEADRAPEADEDRGTGGGPAPRAPGALPVHVVNGTGGDAPAVPGRATAVSEQLRAAGFTRTVTDTTLDPQARTRVFYPQDAQSRADALSVAKALGLPPSQVSPSSARTAVTLVVGADWRSGTQYEGTSPGRDTVPDSADALNGSDEAACMEVYAPYRW